MPCIARFHGIAIYMYWTEHGPPHLHARYADGEAAYNLATLELHEGNPPSKVTQLVRRWMQQHPDELLENWQRCRRKEAPLQIEPLD